LSFILDLVLKTHYVLATAHCQGHCAKVNQVSLHHTSTCEKLRVRIIYTIYQDDTAEGIIGSPAWMIICDTTQLNGLRMCQGNATHPY